MPQAKRGACKGPGAVAGRACAADKPFPCPCPPVSASRTRAHTRMCAHTVCRGASPEDRRAWGQLRLPPRSSRPPSWQSPCPAPTDPGPAAAPHLTEERGRQSPTSGHPGSPRQDHKASPPPPRDTGGTRKLILGHFCFVEHAETSEAFTAQGLKAGAPGNSGSVRTSALPPGGLEQVAWGLSFLASDTEPAVASA